MPLECEVRVELDAPEGSPLVLASLPVKAAVGKVLEDSVSRLMIVYGLVCVNNSSLHLQDVFPEKGGVK